MCVCVMHTHAYVHTYIYIHTHACRTVRDCERRLGVLIAERMDTFSTLATAFNFLACFEVCKYKYV